MTLLLLDVTIRSSALLLVGLVLCATLRRRSAALRHLVLAASLCGSAAVVPLTLMLPAWRLAVPTSVARPVPPSAPSATAPVTVSDREPAARLVAPTSLVGIGWGLGFAVSAAVLLAGVGRLAWIGAGATRVQDGPWARIAEEISASSGLKRRVTVLQTEAPDLLATWGVFRPRVLLPAHARHWSGDRVHAVLCHELAHVRRHDWLVLIGAEALRTVYWFNPLMSMTCARLRRESEQACDDAVLDAGVPPREYAAHLLELARICGRRRWVSVTPMARRSTLERRVTAMLNPALDRRTLSRRALAATAALLLGLTLPIAAARAGQHAPLPLAGSVYDASGAVLPGVAVTLEDIQQLKWQITTDAAGHFEFASVPPGTYILEVSLIGFRPLRQEIELRTAQDWDRAITLQVGEVKETITVRASRASAAPPAFPGPQPVRVGGNIRPPRKLHHVRPVFPASMREAGREGVVPLEAVIDHDGAVSAVRVLSAHVHPDFAIAAVDAVRQWRFDPTLLNGQPVEVRMAVSVEFRLAE